ncbi:lipase family protein [Leucobacter rhizosphaerae]|uniref:Lipase family protein n=1 Tax=Leucobacter rhizosphaerae TaxID=2932245 RepID=A0ABY4FYR4_9MICO|nr:alpha/beta fold hydrolase [Leucobacter rhizosphaerae]UOQ61445.1 lipase family protein [Leucobacter rhizosphaerae]
MLRIAVLAVVAILLVTVGAVVGFRLLGDANEQPGLAAFYEQPENAAEGDPGSIIKSERLEGVPVDTEAWRIMYRTTDLNGDPAVATGVVITPLGAPPADGRTVLAWGHPTTGSAVDCAPSRGFDPFIGIEGMRPMLDRGYTVVATDYVGMGTAGTDSYLVGITAGNSVLDSVRAAQAIPEAAAGSDVVLWGHSQGGQAALFAAERASEYAPELTVRAVAVAAPAADLSALMETHLDDVSGVTIGSYAFQSFAGVYADQGAELSTILTPEAQQILPEMNKLCLLTHIDQLHTIATPVIGKFVSQDPTKVEPWARLLQENSAGSVAFDAPLLIAQGLDDQLVRPADTERLVERTEQLGMDVTYHTVEIADHSTIAYLAIPAVNTWLDELGL